MTIIVNNVFEKSTYSKLRGYDGIDSPKRLRHKQPKKSG
jgi:hypothetical protein